jgi:hypothetical protein
VYFGVRDDDTARETTDLAMVEPALISAGTIYVWLIVAEAGAAVGVFHRDPGRMVIGTGIGALCWGALCYLTGLRCRVPSGPLLTAPADARWERSRARRRMVHTLCWVALTAPGCIGLAWLADWLDLSSAVIPGQFAGFAAASFVAAWRVHRWEEKHRSSIAHRLHEGKDELLAVPRGLSR